jgi:acetyltransferase-like isoleucine patch superfamily enzyme
MFIAFLIKRVYGFLKGEYLLYQLSKINYELKAHHSVEIVSPDRLSLGDGVQMRKNCYIHCGGFQWSGHNGFVIIGDHVTLGENTILYGAGGITIGNYVDIGPGVKIFSSRNHFEKEANDPTTHCFAEVTIEDYAIVFSNVTITPGITIGEGAVIGAGSVVTKDIPSWTVAYGVPARVVKKLKRNIDK